MTGLDWGGALAGPAGDALIARGIVRAPAREAAIDEARRWRADPTTVLLAQTGADAARVADTYAQGLGLRRIDLAAAPPDLSRLDYARLTDYGRYLLLPWRREGDGTVVACVSPSIALLAVAEAMVGGPAILAVTTRADLIAALTAAFAPRLSDEAIHLLARTDPERSAGRPGTIAAWRFWLGLAALAAVAALVPVVALTVVNALIAVFYLGNLLLRGMLVIAGGVRPPSAQPAPAPADSDLPHYTILVPLHDEPAILPILAGALDRLDYPKPLLDIKLILEADDQATLAAARALNLADRYDFVLVPPSHPRTKPKACNYALPLARGDLVVIFDAEDKPESDQLRKAAALFRDAPADLACVQARLNFYNAEENWLTRMFALDYALWFDFLLPGLERLNIPLPLGGTSNHFKTAALREVLAWDPYNVTEDADLGIRLRRRGWRVGTLDSTTFEEATCQTGNWLRQRTRWLKGYIQTWAVHMRAPRDLWRRLGPVGFLGFQFFIGGTVLSSLLNPLVWAACAWWLATGSGALDALFPSFVLAASLLAWLVGNFIFVYLAMIAPFRRNWYDLAPWALTATPYWALISLAGYRALWQYFRRPFLWEKTRHGTSRKVRATLAGHAAAVAERTP
jgi:cellulose synthase/poly-beta-1,6-N-acetylglucosamine synthase-like glycosyltransferase